MYADLYLGALHVDSHTWTFHLHSADRDVSSSHCCSHMDFEHLHEIRNIKIKTKGNFKSRNYIHTVPVTEICTSPHLTTINKFPLKRMGILAIRIRLWLRYWIVLSQTNCSALNDYNNVFRLQQYHIFGLLTLLSPRLSSQLSEWPTPEHRSSLYICVCVITFTSWTRGLGCMEKYVKNSWKNAKALEIKVLNTDLFSTPSQSSLDVFINCLKV